MGDKAMTTAAPPPSILTMPRVSQRQACGEAPYRRFEPKLNAHAVAATSGVVVAEGRRVRRMHRHG